MSVQSTAPRLALEAVSARLSIAVRPTLSLHPDMLSELTAWAKLLQTEASLEHTGMFSCPRYLVSGCASSCTGWLSLLALCTASRAVSRLLS